MCCYNTLVLALPFGNATTNTILWHGKVIWDSANTNTHTHIHIRHDTWATPIEGQRDIWTLNVFYEVIATSKRKANKSYIDKSNKLLAETTFSHSNGADILDAVNSTSLFIRCCSFFSRCIYISILTCFVLHIKKTEEITNC